MSIGYRLPARYIALLSSLADRAEAGRYWLGDVGFRVPAGTPDAQAWALQLDGARWKGMHPDLIPFAEDGFGNRFCFVHKPSESMGHVRSVVYWMYETYRAVPIATDFDGFLYWVALSSLVAARRGDPLVDRAHVEGEIIPHLQAIGLTADIHDALDVPDPDQAELHRAVLRLDATAPGSLVALAATISSDQPLESLRLCTAAIDAFPDFSAARGQAAKILLKDGGGDLVEALVETLLRPLAYSGDPLMPFFRDVHETDPSWTAEMLANRRDQTDRHRDEPVWALILRDDPAAPQSWVQVALDYANEDRLERAATMANNALHLGFATELGPEIHGLLVELYAELGWERHRAAVERWGPTG